mmetsp:Transcript_66966/g.192572  ORF Transcript_66966/g.192572 Transcript_66966/m.192572 type:complete len:131 (+) Transcript_66966:67-459(+)
MPLSETSAEHSAQRGTLSYGPLYVSTRSEPPPGKQVESDSKIVWASTTVDWLHVSHSQDNVDLRLEHRIEETKRRLCEQAAANGCDAILGLNFSLARDRGDKALETRSVTIAMLGQCVVLRDTENKEVLF